MTRVLREAEVPQSAISRIPTGPTIAWRAKQYRFPRFIGGDWFTSHDAADEIAGYFRERGIEVAVLAGDPSLGEVPNTWVLRRIAPRKARAARPLPERSNVPESEDDTFLF